MAVWLLHMNCVCVCVCVCRPVYGLVFLYKFREGEEPQGSVVKDSRLQDIYFAKQVSELV